MTANQSRAEFEAWVKTLPVHFSLHRLDIYTDPIVQKMWEAAVWSMARKWRPIETAPKDVTVLGLWLGAPGCEEVDVVVQTTNHPTLANPVWCAHDNCSDVFCAPDYWMPMPEAPDMAELEEGKCT